MISRSTLICLHKGPDFLTEVRPIFFVLPALMLRNNGLPHR